MDQIKIGKFIAECRKDCNMTQSQMAEKLGVSNKSVSRWETGRNMPDVSLFIPLCELLGITVNELIIGERIMKNMEEKTTQVIIDTIDNSNKKINKARIIFYIAVLIAETGLCTALSLTAAPSDAMAVPLGGLLITAIASVLIGLLNIKMIYKLFFVPLSVIMFFLTQLIYWGSMDREEFIVYSAAIAVSQIVIILAMSGIVYLIKKIKNRGA